MRWLSEGDARSCFIFATLMLAAVVITCAVVTGTLLTETGMSALTTSAQPVQSSASGDQSWAGADVNSAAPDFSLPDLDGKQVSLRHFAGQPVMVNFWASWCGPCQAEIPHLVKAYEREQGEVVFVAISVEEPAGTVRRFAEENDMAFIILLDGGGEVASDYRVRGIPTTFFISRDGEIVARYVGAMSPNRLEEGLSRIR